MSEALVRDEEDREPAAGEVESCCQLDEQRKPRGGGGGGKEGRRTCEGRTREKRRGASRANKPTEEVRVLVRAISRTRLREIKDPARDVGAEVDDHRQLRVGGRRRGARHQAAAINEKVPQARYKTAERKQG